MTGKLHSRKGTTLAFNSFSFVLLILLASRTKGLPKDNAFKKANSRMHILLMLRAESTYGLEEVMSDSPACTGMQRSNSSFERQIIDSDYYGSTLLDQWKEHTPVYLSLLLTNYRGDILWSISFRVQDKNSSMLHTWFKSENIVVLDDFEDNPESTGTLAANIHLPGFSVQPQPSNNTAYLGIRQRNENITHCSKMPSYFYFSNSSSTAFEIQKDQSTEFNFIGCYEPAYLADYVYVILSHSSQCHAVCSSEGYNYFGFLQSNNMCYCIPDSILVPSTGVKEDSCKLVAGYVMSGYRTVDVSLTQTEVVVKSMNLTAGNTSKVYFGNQTGFVTAVHVYNIVGTKLTNESCQYNLSYSKVDCDRERYHKLSRNTIFDCGVKEYLPRGVQKMKCLVIDLPDISFADIDIYGIEEPYIAGPVLMLMGHYNHNPVKDDGNYSTSDGMTEVSTSILTKETVWTTSTIVITATVTEITPTAVPVSIASSFTTPDTLQTAVASVEPKKKCCFCDCSMYTAYYKWHTEDQSTNDSAIEESSIASITNELKANTTVNKTTLSSYVRTKNCAFDPRPASRYVGTCGIILLVIVVVCIFLIDISSLRFHIMTIRHDIHGQ